MENLDNMSKVNRKSDRLLSLDALRGFDMLWIVGGSNLIYVLANLTNTDWLKTLAVQMDHVPWEGFHFYDLIFPLFMFVAGIAITLSVKAKLTVNMSKRDLLLKAFKRMLLLVLLGILYNGVFRDGFSHARYASILGQIGISYFFASAIIIYSKSFKATIFWLSGILLGVAFLQLFVPVPGFGAGVLTPEGHINGYIDRLFLPGRLAYGHDGRIDTDGIYEALGILSIISAIGITLMGTIAGYILQKERLTEYRKTGLLAVTGIVLMLVALIISPFYPIIKNCWTTTYNLLAGGISFILFALFYLVIDVWHYQKWSFFFRIIGINSIFIYLFFHFMPLNSISEVFVGWISKPMGDTGQLVNVLGYLTGEWLLLYFMYTKKIFIKV